jgi:dolichol-phosphate mannosyltransferase
MSEPTALGRVLVIIPTFNEAENLRPIVGRLRTSVPEADILVADDNSPDGTGAIADELAAADEHVHVLHRKGKEGLGAAYIAGFTWGLERGYGVLVQHDADGSHRPEQLPSLLERLETADMVKGSRWVKGGRTVNWPLSRQLISRGGSTWTRLWLGIPLKDVTGGFNAWRADTLRGIDLAGVEAAGYGFQVDLAWRAVRHGFTVAEVPITFADRTAGDSKMSSAIVFEAMLLTTRWGLKHRLSQLKGAAEATPEVLDRTAGKAGELAQDAGEKAEVLATSAGRAAGGAARRVGSAIASGIESFRARRRGPDGGEPE